jgi:hypothetical protein
MTCPNVNRVFTVKDIPWVKYSMDLSWLQMCIVVWILEIIYNKQKLSNCVNECALCDASVDGPPS